MDVSQVNQKTNQAPPKTPPKGPQPISDEDIIDGVQKTPVRLFIYGSEGIGKSTFASKAPYPIWMGADKGTQHLPIKRIKQPKSWLEMLDRLRQLRVDDRFQTVVLDPMGWIEDTWLVPYVLETNGWRDLKQPGYGDGYDAVADQWRVACKLLEAISDAGKNVVLIAHSEIKRVTPPDMLEGYDRYQVKMMKKGAAIFREWCDYVLFAREKESIEIGKDKKARGKSSGIRVFHSTKTAAYEAKARPALDIDPLPLAWDEFAAAREASDPAHRVERCAELKRSVEAALKSLDAAQADYTAKVRAFLPKVAADDVERMEEVLNKVSLKIQEQKESES